MGKIRHHTTCYQSCIINALSMHSNISCFSCQFLYHYIRLVFLSTSLSPNKKWERRQFACLRGTDLITEFFEVIRIKVLMFRPVGLQCLREIRRERRTTKTLSNIAQTKQMRRATLRRETFLIQGMTTTPMDSTGRLTMANPVL